MRGGLAGAPLFADFARHMDDMHRHMDAMVDESNAMMASMLSQMSGIASRRGAGQEPSARFIGGGRSHTGHVPRGSTYHRTHIYQSVNTGNGPRTEQFEEASLAQNVGGSLVRETTQKYSNSATGVRRMGLERAIGARARKIVREQRHTGEELKTDMLRGISEDETDKFDAEWEHITGTRANTIGGARNVHRIPDSSRRFQQPREHRRDRSRPSARRSQPGRHTSRATPNRLALASRPW